MKINNNFLQIFYNFLLSGMPNLSYNPINQNILHAPLKVKEYSTYINFNLDNEQVVWLNQKINRGEKKNSNHKFQIIPVSILNNEPKKHILSINIYNCTSPIFEFIEKEPVTRCEVNTYIKQDKKEGTLIMDYISNIISLDPDNLIKFPDKLIFNKKK